MNIGGGQIFIVIILVIFLGAIYLYTKKKF